MTSSGTKAEDSAVISGIGQSNVGRGLMRSGISLTVEATLEALADAGLNRTDIDGVATYPGAMARSPGMSPMESAPSRTPCDSSSTGSAADPRRLGSSVRS